MGQRLNLEIHKDGEVLANAYYHWSGYTSSACYEALKAVKSWLNIEDTISPLITAIKMLEATGAGFNESELQSLEESGLLEKYEINKTDLKPCTGKSDGIIAITSKEIENTRYWEEHRAILDLYSLTFDLSGVFWDYDPEEYDEEDFKKFKVTTIDFDIEEIPFDKIHYVIEQLNDADVIETPYNQKFVVIR